MKYTHLILTALLLLGSQLDAKQMFNVKTIEVKKVLEGSAKEFYGYTKANEESVKEVALRYDAFIEQLYVEPLADSCKQPII